mmetsp:Transcript_25827/g.49040  ORF Transcript_25827/g.49040 Transcript_25827/m.49040 type:complete len:253 (+) Transcript_25827:109-867(+)|eukprot:CAMPEP_0114245778 /NCGR_PEP_ID=MMETSP0058-20121206/12091_1 /TAXON_ID=36894 /ORGANISM="Pyramimonas parkeae, CCMP726" /LENGTH=252 /DNA_ID=CAMNT_0001358881 /DNA_START=109 /DNA_END=867 /DNA_ORIENTATION=-
MPIDYNKWNNLSLSDDETDEAPKKPAVATSNHVAAPKPDRPQEAAGSSWNLNSWHFEESNYDKWGKDRLMELLHEAVGNYTIDFNDAELDLLLTVKASKIEGEAWTHIRKGKKATGYNYEMALTWVGIVSGRDMSEQVHGSLDYELTVDDDEPDTVFKCAQNHIPFVPQVKTCLLRLVCEKCAIMVSELSKKGGGDGWKVSAETSNVQVGQYTKYTQGVDGTARSQEVASQLKKGDGDHVKQKTLHTNEKTH